MDRKHLAAPIWAVLLLLTVIPNGYCDILSTGPATNAAVFWIDPTQPNTNVPPMFQQWGTVVSVPDGDTALTSASFYVESLPTSAGAATRFGLQIYNWTGSQPSGPPIYASGQVSLLIPNTNPPDPSDAFGVSPTVFAIGVPVVATNRYIFELIGDGVVGIETAAATATAQLYLNQDTLGWQPFDGDAFRSDIAFNMSSPSAVPEPASSLAFLSGLLAWLSWPWLRAGCRALKLAAVKPQPPPMGWYPRRYPGPESAGAGPS